MPALAGSILRVSGVDLDRLGTDPTLDALAGSDTLFTLSEAPGVPSGVRRFGLGDVDGDGVMDAITVVETATGMAAFVHRGGADGPAAAGVRVGP